MSRRQKHKEVKIPPRTRKFQPEKEEEHRGYKPRLLTNPPAPFKVFIAMPTRDMVPAEFMFDLVQAVGLAASTVVADGIVELGTNVIQSTAVQVGRQELSEAVLAQGDVTHILWLDTDHRFKADSFFRIFKHLKRSQEEKFIVGANYSTRKFPPRAVAFKHLRKPFAKPDDDENVLLFTLPTSSGLEEVDAVGFGFVLMPVEVLRDIGDDKQYFMFYHNPDNLRQWMGEDVYFCRLAKQAGWKIFVDHDLSQEIGHLGTFEFRNAHACYVTNEEMKQYGPDHVLRPADGDFDMARAQRLDECDPRPDHAGGSEPVEGSAAAQCGEPDADDSRGHGDGHAAE
jgi:hypothetical protein